MGFKTAIARVRGHGPARSGTEHWWHERLSALASIPLTIFLVGLGISLAGSGHEEVTQSLRKPLVAIGLVLALSVMAWHMRLGMQVIIEDYVEGISKMWLLIANNFFTAAVWAAGLYAVAKLNFGA